MCVCVCILRFAFDQSESGEISKANHSANALKLPAKFQMISRELFQSLGGKSFFGPRPAFFLFFFFLSSFPCALMKTGNAES